MWQRCTLAVLLLDEILNYGSNTQEIAQVAHCEARGRNEGERGWGGKN